MKKEMCEKPEVIMLNDGASKIKPRSFVIGHVVIIQ